MAAKGLLDSPRRPRSAPRGPRTSSWAVLVAFGAVSGASWAVWDASWAVLVAFGAVSGASWAAWDASWGPLGGLLGCLRGIPCRHGPFLIGVRGGRAAKASGRQRGYLQECACTQQRSIAIMGISISLSSETSQSLNGGTVYSPPGAWVASLPASTATTMLSVQSWFGSSPRVARGAPLTTSLERGRR